MERDAGGIGRRLCDGDMIFGDVGGLLEYVGDLVTRGMIEFHDE